ncbi:hypothetical protein ROLI_004430 [Roseobacter fucihabitans]|uniref:Uncharacterized protein n=1 Tax=Roseobacter fucihabitans TaxID=1537242 RepID=A0ABZ2BNA5_9RHOB|nr:hypothetical protein [Roseobacter litoralis]MBC6964617.1 hypothetical protein [Roseobacter litoralis]
MEAFFSKEIQAGLDQARVTSLKKASRLRVTVGNDVYPVLRLWKSGFSMEADAPSLRGLVDLYDGSLHLMQCLIITNYAQEGERRYEFKRATVVAEGPAVDFEVEETAPKALIEDARGAIADR